MARSGHGDEHSLAELLENGLSYIVRTALRFFCDDSFSFLAHDASRGSSSLRRSMLSTARIICERRSRHTVRFTSWIFSSQAMKQVRNRSISSFVNPFWPHSCSQFALTVCCIASAIEIPSERDSPKLAISVNAFS